MIIHYILIMLLVVIVLLLAMALYFLVRKSTYISDKEKEFMIFVIDIFIEYGDDLGIQSKDQHKKLVEELEKIKKKIRKNG
jgi:competence protein ComGF